MLLPYEEVKNLPGLRLSPIGVVPQRGRRPRLIVDYSFWGINAATVRLSDPASMQFGRAQRRLLQNVAWAHPAHGPVYSYKIDLSDGFYRVPLSTSGSAKLGVLLPPLLGEQQLVAFPLVLPMGWCESPPFFCKFTETICDMANRDLQKNIRHPPHRLEAAAGAGDFCPNPDRGPDSDPTMATPASHQPLLRRRPLASVDVFVDDFIGQGQDTPRMPVALQRRAVLSRIDQVFRPNDADDPPFRKEPTSEKKLRAQDASVQDIKRCLGWDFATKSRHLLRAPHREERVREEVTQALSSTRVGHTKWLSLIGQLRSLQDGVPGVMGQFSILQDTSQGEHKGRVRIRPDTREQLEAILDLFDSPRPTRVEELVPGIPHDIGACDAALAGMGGVWFTHDDQALLWRAPFPKSIQDKFVSWEHPSGTISNSDLELVGTIVQQAVLGHHKSLQGETTYTACDNTPSVAWRQKGSATSSKCRAYLLRLAADVTRHQESLPLFGHIAGEDNVMADDASRRWDLNDDEILTYFNSTYPQAASWKWCHPPADVLSKATSALLRRTSSAASAPSEETPPGQPGASGTISASKTVSLPTSAGLPTPSPSSSFSRPGGATVALHPKGSRSWLDQQRTRVASSARRFPFWGPRTLGMTSVAASSSS